MSVECERTSSTEARSEKVERAASRGRGRRRRRRPVDHVFFLFLFRHAFAVANWHALERLSGSARAVSILCLRGMTRRCKRENNNRAREGGLARDRVAIPVVGGGGRRQNQKEFFRRQFRPSFGHMRASQRVGRTFVLLCETSHKRMRTNSCEAGAFGETTQTLFARDSNSTQPTATTKKNSTPSFSTPLSSPIPNPETQPSPPPPPPSPPSPTAAASPPCATATA